MVRVAIRLLHAWMEMVPLALTAGASPQLHNTLHDIERLLNQAHSHPDAKAFIVAHLGPVAPIVPPQSTASERVARSLELVEHQVAMWWQISSQPLPLNVGDWTPPPMRSHGPVAIMHPLAALPSLGAARGGSKTKQ